LRPGLWQVAIHVTERRSDGAVPVIVAGESLQRRARYAAAPAPRLRRSLDARGVTTLEAIAEALELCGEPGPAAQLREVHAAVLRRSERLRGRLPAPRDATTVTPWVSARGDSSSITGEGVHA